MSPSYAWRAQDELRRKPPTKSEQARAWLQADPDVPDAELAERLGCTRSLVSAVRRELYGPVPRQRPERRAAPAIVPLRPFPQARRGHCTRYGDSAWWQSDDPEEQEAARHICAGCPVRDDCLAFIMTIPGYQDTAGIWGGTTPAQRVKLRQQLAS